MDQIYGNIPDNDRWHPVISCNTGPDALSCHHLQIIEIITLAFIGNIGGLFGVIGNIINIIIFYKHGFASAVNISFFSMAVSDLCCQITLLWLCVCINPFIYLTGVPWVPIDFSDLPGGWPYLAFGRITCYITVFVTAERCLSIITPLKVKEIITPKRATVIISFIYIINILIVLPEYGIAYLEYKFFPEINASFIATTFVGNTYVVNVTVFYLGSFTNILSFVGVIVLTIILVVKLQQSSKWRKQSNNDRERIISTRDKKTIKMVAIIASVLIACYTPGTMGYFATVIEPEINYEGRYMNVFLAIWSTAYASNSVNSSVNIFLYYRMSSKYRQTFDEFFRRKSQLKNPVSATYGKMTNSNLVGQVA